MADWSDWSDEEASAIDWRDAQYFDFYRDNYRPQMTIDDLAGSWGTWEGLFYSWAQEANCYHEVNGLVNTRSDDARLNEYIAAFGNAVFMINMEEFKAMRERGEFHSG
jgi:hypothetical protein